MTYRVLHGDGSVSGFDSFSSAVDDALAEGGAWQITTMPPDPNTARPRVVARSTTMTWAVPASLPREP